MSVTPEISIILPCLNEEKSIGICLDEIIGVINKEKLDAEILVVDNDSKDRSANIVSIYSNKDKRIRLITEKKRGYGSTYLRGFDESRGMYIFMADADSSYDFNDIPIFISKLKNGYDLVVGNRFSGYMDRDSMPFLHKYIGNPVLSLITKIFFRISINDIHCGARAISKEALSKITLYTTGMEFASEMIIKCAKAHMKIAEIPIKYRKRIGDSKLRSFRDGWRHLRFILLYSPIVIFLIPGISLFLIGGISIPLLKTTSINSIFLASTLIILGYQFVFFAVFARIYAITHLGERDEIFEKLFKIITIEKAVTLGIIMIAISAYLYIFTINKIPTSYSSYSDNIKNLTSFVTMIVLGIQTIGSAFMLSILGIKEKRL